MGYSDQILSTHDLLQDVATKVAGATPDKAQVVKSYSAPYAGAAALTVGTAAAVGRAVGVVCTVAGNVALTLADASTITVPVAVGFTVLPFAATTVNTSGTTATASYYNLK